MMERWQQELAAAAVTTVKVIERPRSSRSRYICLLTYEEAAALHLHGILPSCESGHHRHVTFNKAIEMIANDLACTVGEEHGLVAIVEHLSNGYVWKSRMSGGVKVRQMRRLVQG